VEQFIVKKLLLFFIQFNYCVSSFYEELVKQKKKTGHRIEFNEAGVLKASRTHPVKVDPSTSSPLPLLPPPLGVLAKSTTLYPIRFVKFKFRVKFYNFELGQLSASTN